ncbi:IS30 family transposase, partial [Williamwhitmania taraxaci]
VTAAAVEALSPLAHQMHTITADNGKEFAAHQVIAEKLQINFYFARPYHSWERGANENANRLVRQYFPKKTDFKTITQEQVQWVEDILNSRPRKRLGFISPLLTYNQLTQVAFVS